jgi:hypothetical protein
MWAPPGYLNSPTLQCQSPFPLTPTRRSSVDLLNLQACPPSNNQLAQINWDDPPSLAGDAEAAAQPDGGDEAMAAADSAAEAAVAADGNPQFFPGGAGGGGSMGFRVRCLFRCPGDCALWIRE